MRGPRLSPCHVLSLLRCSRLSTASWASARPPGRRRGRPCGACCPPAAPGSRTTQTFGDGEGHADPGGQGGGGGVAAGGPSPSSLSPRQHLLQRRRNSAPFLGRKVGTARRPLGFAGSVAPGLPGGPRCRLWAGSQGWFGPPEGTPLRACLALKRPLLYCRAFSRQASATMHLPAAIGERAPRAAGALRYCVEGEVMGEGWASPLPSLTQAALEAGALAGRVPSAGVCRCPRAPPQQITPSRRPPPREEFPAHL